MRDFGKFEYFLPTRIVFGIGTINKLGEFCDSLGKKALIVTGKHSAKATGLLGELLRRIDGGASCFIDHCL